MLSNGHNLRFSCIFPTFQSTGNCLHLPHSCLPVSDCYASNYTNQIFHAPVLHFFDLSVPVLLKTLQPRIHFWSSIPVSVFQSCHKAKPLQNRLHSSTFLYSFLRFPYPRLHFWSFCNKCNSKSLCIWPHPFVQSSGNSCRTFRFYSSDSLQHLQFPDGRVLAYILFFFKDTWTYVLFKDSLWSFPCTCLRLWWCCRSGLSASPIGRLPTYAAIYKDFERDFKLCFRRNYLPSFCLKWLFVVYVLIIFSHCTFVNTIF